jgi:phosphoglycolate phosphatase-like HAD superfamily hydrolase
VIFDLDGTLCDTVEIDDDCYRETAAAALQVPTGDIDWSGAPHHTDSGIARWLWERFRSRPPTREEVEAFQRDFFLRLEARRLEDPRRFLPIEGALPFLNSLQQEGTTVGIGTGGWRVSAELKLAEARLDLGLLYATADDAETRVEVFSLAYARAVPTPQAPPDTVLVGDGVWDADAARRLGWRFVGVGAGAVAARLREAGAAEVVPNYLGLNATDALHRARIPPLSSLAPSGPTRLGRQTTGRWAAGGSGGRDGA